MSCNYIKILLLLFGMIFRFVTFGEVEIRKGEKTRQYVNFIIYCSDSHRS
jgi:cytochrome bd-type quinol oxidase subunit 2